MTTYWTITAANPLLGALGPAVELGGLSIAAVVTNANAGPITSGLDPSAVGQLIGAFYLGTSGPLQIASPADITPGSAALTPTVGAGGTVSVNWDGTFALDLTLCGMPLITVDESVCMFDEVGPDIDFGANYLLEPPPWPFVRRRSGAQKCLSDRRTRHRAASRGSSHAVDLPAPAASPGSDPFAGTISATKSVIPPSSTGN